MIEKYYTIHDKVTVCIILAKNGMSARGIAVCSDEDEFDYEEGKLIAKRNAIRILKGRTVDYIKRDEIIRILEECSAPFTRKAELNPDLSFAEMKLILGNRKYIDLYKNAIEATEEEVRNGEYDIQFAKR